MTSFKEMFGFDITGLNDCLKLETLIIDRKLIDLATPVAEAEAQVQSIKESFKVCDANSLNTGRALEAHASLFALQQKINAQAVVFREAWEIARDAGYETNDKLSDYYPMPQAKSVA